MPHRPLHVCKLKSEKTCSVIVPTANLMLKLLWLFSDLSLSFMLKKNHCCHHTHKAATRVNQQKKKGIFVFLAMATPGASEWKCLTLLF